MPHLLILRGTVGAGKSSVAASIREYRAATRVVEVDEIKRRRHGTTEHCDPPVDFPEAGREARAQLDQGWDTILIEAFVDFEHLDLALDATGRHTDSEDVTVVWLECSRDVAGERTITRLAPDVVCDQYRRYRDRYQAPGEHVIGTDRREASDVAHQVLRLLPPRFGLNTATR